MIFVLFCWALQVHTLLFFLLLLLQFEVKFYFLRAVLIFTSRY